MTNVAVLDRFWSKVFRPEHDGCWEWTAGCSGDGYGAFRSHGRQVGAHRFSFELHHGPIPSGMQVLHRCDNTICVRPDHLFLGTVTDNMRDKAAKLRGIHGANNPKAKLDEVEVRRIRERVARGECQRAIARELGVGYLAIYRIVHRLTWRHVA